MKKDLRLRFINWLCDLCNYPVEEIPPRWIRNLYAVLYPLRASYEKQSKIKYDFRRDAYEIEGIKFSRGVFQMLANSAMVGETFKLLQNDNRVITIERFPLTFTIKGEDILLHIKREIGRNRF